MPVARTPAEVVAGEAVSGTPEQRWNDMLAIASVMYNRAALTGTTLDDVVSVPSQFNAFGQNLPPGTSSLVDMAQAALDQVAATGPVVDATYYATPAAVDNLPNGLTPVGATTGHQYFNDPAMRGIITAQGAIQPNPANLPSLASQDPLQQAAEGTYAANGLVNGVNNLVPGLPSTAVTTTATPGIAADPAFGANGLLTGDFPTSSFSPISATPSAENYAGLGVEASTAVPGLLGNVPASADAGASLGLDADARVTGLISNASPFDRMGVPVSSFTSMAAAQPVSTPMSINGILGAMNTPQLDAAASVPMSASLFSPAVSQPVPNSFADLAAAGPISAPLGQETVKSPTLNNFGDLAAATPISAPMSVPATAQAVTTPGLLASAQVNPFSAPAVAQPTGILSGYQSTPTSTAAENAIGGLLSQPSSLTPAAIAGYQQYANTAMPGGITSLSGTTLVGPTGFATTNMPSLTPAVNVATDPAVAMPNLTTISVKEQPSIAGPVNTPAVAQQQSQTPTLGGYFPAAPKSGLLGGLVNKGSLTGGVLGSLAAGPVGGLLGGLLGNQINKSGGLTGLLGNNDQMSIHSIPGGLQNIGAIYGGSMPVGTQAPTNNGGFVTSLPGGYTAYTSPTGVTTSFTPGGYTAGYFGPSLTGNDTEKNGTSGPPGGGGGYSPGLF